jgi:sugar phosphate isomerase/epimerase
LKIAAQLYTLRDFLKTPDDVAKTFKKVKEIGYNAVQISGLGPIDDQQVKDLADQNGLNICATHVSFNDLKNDFDAVAKKHQIWDCQYVGVGSLPGEYRENKEGYIRFAQEASEIGRKLKSQGMTFLYHNHAFEYVRFDGKSAMEILFDESDPEAFDFELDVHWVQAGGADPVEWIHKVNGRMKVVHLKDFVVNDKSERLFAEVGEGNMNMAGILKACQEIGVEWAPVEQDNCYGRDPFESLAISFNNLKKMGVEA